MSTNTYPRLHASSLAAVFARAQRLVTTPQSRKQLQTVPQILAGASKLWSVDRTSAISAGGRASLRASRPAGSLRSSSAAPSLLSSSTATSTASTVRVAEDGKWVVEAHDLPPDAAEAETEEAASSDAAARDRAALLLALVESACRDVASALPPGTSPKVLALLDRVPELAAEAAAYEAGAAWVEACRLHEAAKLRQLRKAAALVACDVDLRDDAALVDVGDPLLLALMDVTGCSKLLPAAEQRRFVQAYADADASVPDMAAAVDAKYHPQLRGRGFVL